MFGYSLLNAAMYFWATGVSWVQPHQLTSPDVAGDTTGACAEVVLLHAARLMTRADAAIAANKRDFIVAFLSIVDASLGDSGASPASPPGWPGSEPGGQSS